MLLRFSAKVQQYTWEHPNLVLNFHAVSGAPPHFLSILFNSNCLVAALYTSIKDFFIPLLRFLPAIHAPISPN